MISAVEFSPAPDLAALAGTTPAATGETTDGGFQALLTALLGQVAGETATTAPGAGPAPATPAEADDAGNKPESAMLDSLAAMAWLGTPAQTPAPTPVTAEAAPREGTAASALGAKTSELPQVPGLGTGATPTELPELELPMGEKPGAEKPVTQPPSELTDIVVAETAEAKTSQPTAADTAGAVPTAGAATTAIAAGMPPAEAPEKKRETDEVSPPVFDMAGATAETNTNESPEANASTNTIEGVVRTVGNASSESSQPIAISQAAAPEAETDEVKASNAPETRGIEAARASSPGSLAATDEAAPVAEARPAATAAPTEQVARAIIERIGDGGGDAVIRLDPAELGHVRIRVHTGSDGVRVEVHAERPEAVALLRESTPDLSSLLSGQGLELANVFVGLGGRDTAGQGQDGAPWAQRGQQPRNGEFASILGIGDPGSVERHNRLRSAYNPDGQHMYRV